METEVGVRVLVWFELFGNVRVDERKVLLHVLAGWFLLLCVGHPVNRWCLEISVIYWYYSCYAFFGVVCIQDQWCFIGENGDNLQ